MRGAVIHAPGDVRFETLDDPKILKPTDAIIRTAVTCVCGSDLWPWRGLDVTNDPHPMGHEYVGFIEEIGSEVTGLRPGQFVVGSFATSDNTCANCANGFQSSCLHREFMSTCQAEYIRIPNAQGTLVALDETPDEALWPGLLALSDVMGTGWWAADAAEVRPGSTAVVVGDGAVGLSGVIAAKEMGAERIIAMSRHESRQKLALEFGATDVVTERGEEGVARIKELTGGIGADSVL
ncbi:alcohol dehydrogenase catalytic domain-containing protein, partial [Streptomyces sp. NPDC097704]|uniref:alcohol dehydrogenase catalytic domain-containing protein n=1 Tax=Streptomyces sp. NPDC097704 TaxID=3157101 RepID=UPI00332CDD72